MAEFVKVLCALVIIVGGVTAMVSWVEDRPDESTWTLRIASTAACVVAVAVFVLLATRVDIEPDLLKRMVGKRYFDRGGFCFHLVPRVEGETLIFDIWWQNRFAKPCQAVVAMKPRQRRTNLAPLRVDVECAGGAFGVTHVPVALTERDAGKRRGYDLGVGVEYPGGRGEKLRFHDGSPVRTDERFCDRTGSTMTLLALLGGFLFYSRGPRFDLRLPDSSNEAVGSPATRTLWRPGDETRLEDLSLDTLLASAT